MAVYIRFLCHIHIHRETSLGEIRILLGSVVVNRDCGVVLCKVGIILGIR